MKHYALITGAISGLGLAYAKWFAGKGYDLIITGRRKEVIERRAREIRDKFACKVIAILVDLVQEDGVRKLLASLEGREVHVLVNNAYFGFRTPFSDTDIDGLKHLTYPQIIAVAEITHYVLKGMKERNEGIIINISSDGAFAVVPGNVTYTAAKRFIVTLTEGPYMEPMGTGIRVQTMCPGFVDTGFHENNGVYVDETRKGMFGFRQSGEVVDEAMKEFEKGSIVCVPDKARKLVKAMAEYMSKKTYCWFADDFVNKNIQKN